MAKMSACVLLACVLMAGSAVASPTVKVTRTDGYWQGDGGEFTLTPNSELAALLGSAAAFESFCLERSEGIGTSGQIYKVQLNDEALLGGTNYGDTGDDNGDLLDERTAYLYTEFRAGTLANYDYDPLATRAASAGALQNVIWFIEDEMEQSWVDGDGSLEDLFYQAAADAVEGNWTGLGNVCVLNNYDMRSGANQQDMLGIASTVPAPGALVLGALGSCVVGFLRRRHMM